MMETKLNKCVRKDLFLIHHHLQGYRNFSTLKTISEEKSIFPFVSAFTKKVVYFKNVLIQA